MEKELVEDYSLLFFLMKLTYCTRKINVEELLRRGRGVGWGGGGPDLIVSVACEPSMV